MKRAGAGPLAATALAAAAGALCAPLVPAPAAAQISVDTKEGWTFTFAGNVNAFYLFEREARGGGVTTPGALIGAGRQGSAVRSGYLPAFAVLSAKRVEGPTTVGVHFGFAPQVQTSGGHEDSTGLGARIDMRQVYLTASGSWGQLLAGREIGVFARQNLLGDMSLFGTGATGGNFGDRQGATLGRSGFGYLYPGFNAQVTYSTPVEDAVQFTAGIFDPSANNGYDELLLPRLETEVSYTLRGSMVWAGALVQHEKDSVLGLDATAWGVTGGVRLKVGAVSAAASGYSGRGIGTTRVFGDARTSDPTLADLRPSWGYLGQVTWTATGRPLTLGASYGESILKSARSEVPFRTVNRSVTGGAYVQVTPSLKAVGEVTQAWSTDADPGTRANSSIAAAAGLMLFF